MTEQLTDIGILRKIPIFSSLSDTELAQILKAPENGIIDFAPKETIIKEAEIGAVVAIQVALLTALSARYGFIILPRAERWNSVNRLSWIGPYLLRQGRKSEGIEIIERWVEYRPKSTFALGALADAYEANNQIDKALSTLNKAYKLSQELEMQNSEEYLRKLEALKIKIQGK